MSICTTTISILSGSFWWLVMKRFFHSILGSFFFDNTIGVMFGFLILFPMNWSFDMLVVLIHAIVDNHAYINIG